MESYQWRKAAKSPHFVVPLQLVIYKMVDLTGAVTRLSATMTSLRQRFPHLGRALQLQASTVKYHAWHVMTVLPIRERY